MIDKAVEQLNIAYQAVLQAQAYLREEMYAADQDGDNQRANIGEDRANDLRHLALSLEHYRDLCARQSKILKERA